MNVLGSKHGPDDGLTSRRIDSLTHACLDYSRHFEGQSRRTQCTS